MNNDCELQCPNCKLTKYRDTGWRYCPNCGTELVEVAQAPIFRGDYSTDMWDAINTAKSKGDLRRALYLVCCRVQELEVRLTTP